jgi:sugar lactone lactonase YvrE
MTFLNDIALAPNGDAYITDSYRPMMFKIGGNGAQPGELENWLDFTGSIVPFVPNTFALNGIVVSGDGAYIVTVHTDNQKLYRITIATKAVCEVDVGGAKLPGDGMLLDGQTLDVVVRTADSEMIFRIQMTPDFARGTILYTFRDSSFAYPTTIAKAGNRILVVNSQFNKRGEGLKPKLPFTISDIPVPP